MNYRFAWVACLSTLVSACDGSTPDDSHDVGAHGAVAHDAAEAWPDVPNGVPVISTQDLLAACGRAGECAPEVMQLDQSQRLALVDLCLTDAVFSAERAIPLSGFSSAFNERVEFWTKCVLDAQDCGAVTACKTERDDRIECQEDGCYSYSDVGKSCSGDVVTLNGGGTRDCSRAFASCDLESPTGCTDRPFTQCPDGVSKADRCDGGVRLGCDGAGQVSYHDCTRLGGTCGTLPEGGEGCVYPKSPECSTQVNNASSCKNGSLEVCVLGQALSLASAICGP